MNHSFLIPEYIQELLNSSHKGLEAIVATLTKLVQARILITSPMFYILSASFPASSSDTVQVSPINANDIFFCEINNHSLHVNGMGRSINPTGRVIGYIFILFDDEHADYSPYEAILSYASSLCAHHIQKQIEIEQEKSKQKNSFFYDLLFGNITRQDEIITLGEIWGWDFRQPHRAVYFQILNLEIHSSDLHLLEMLRRMVTNSFLEKYHLEPALFAQHDELVLLMPVTDGDKKKPKQNTAHFVLSIINQTALTELKGRVTCGIGQTYSDPSELFRSYQEAKVACELGMLLDNVTPSFEDIGLERILYKHDLQDLKEFYHHVLGKLTAQETNCDWSLLETLKNFSLNQFDIVQTSQALFIHRNTLRYRLRKIEDILQCSLDDIDIRLDIHAAFKIKQLHKL